MLDVVCRAGTERTMWILSVEDFTGLTSPTTNNVRPDLCHQIFYMVIQKTYV